MRKVSYVIRIIGDPYSYLSVSTINEVRNEVNRLVTKGYSLKQLEVERKRESIDTFKAVNYL